MHWLQYWLWFTYRACFSLKRKEKNYWKHILSMVRWFIPSLSYDFMFWRANFATKKRLQKRGQVTPQMLQGNNNSSKLSNSITSEEKNPSLIERVPRSIEDPRKKIKSLLPWWCQRKELIIFLGARRVCQKEWKILYHLRWIKSSLIQQ